MSRRARYSGGSLTGVDVKVELVDGQKVQVHVDPNHLLPEEVEQGDRKVAVLASERDRLLEQKNIWSEVDQTASKPKDKE
jgi:hypothetical protein